MLTKFLTGAAIAVMLAAAGPASALTWESELDFRDGDTNDADAPYGKVVLEELDANNVKVTVTLTNAASKFINTGGPHDPFLFNLNNTTSTGVINAPVDTFIWGGQTGGPFNATPFGDFTNVIKCCGAKNGEKAGDLPPLIFTVTNLGGLTFAGVGATVDSNGLLTDEGTGNRFASNAGGWWFAADIYDGASGLTYNVVARDAICRGDGCQTTVVPEPNTWALMILGFGAAGAMIRRRKTVFA